MTLTIEGGTTYSQQQRPGDHDWRTPSPPPCGLWAASSSWGPGSALAWEESVETMHI